MVYDVILYLFAVGCAVYAGYSDYLADKAARVAMQKDKENKQLLERIQKLENEKRKLDSRLRSKRGEYTLSEIA